MVKRHRQKWQWKRFGAWQKIFFRFFLKITVPTAVLALGAGAFLGVRNRLYADPYFQVEQVSVFPSGLLYDSEYRSLEAELRRKNLFQIDLRAISQKLEQNPAVKRAEVVRSFPNQLKIVLIPRTSLLQVQCVPHGPYYSVSEDRVIVSVSQTPRPGFIIVEDFNDGKKTYGSGAVYKNPYFSEWQPFFTWFHQNPVLKSEFVSKFSVDHLGNMTAVLGTALSSNLEGCRSWAPLRRPFCARCFNQASGNRFYT